MKSFMVMATFRPGTNMDDVLQHVAAERARIAELESEGKLAAVYLANTERKTVFLVVNAATLEEATSIVATLPMSAWWDLEVFPLNAPAPLSDVPAAQSSLDPG